MKSSSLFLLLTLVTLLSSWRPFVGNWITEKHNGYDLVYTASDSKDKEDYTVLLENGIATVKAFFTTTFNQPFAVYLHPNRHSLDSTWQKDWQIPDFSSECWMVASGVATKLDMMSPSRWDKEACEHKYTDTKKTQQLITHELAHVYHGQQNASPDFSSVEGIDWFVEGLATYASGQCDDIRMAEVKQAIADDSIPNELDAFWTGKLKYGLSGSVVMFIDHRYGRDKLTTLLPFTKKTELLAALETTESELLIEWKRYMRAL